MRRYIFVSEKGKRESQEDFYGNFKNEFFVVADGLGGHPAGEVAAKLAVERGISSYKQNLSLYAKTDLVKIFGEANKAVYKKAQKKPELTGMGTTLVCAVIQSNKLTAANVGDSRCYIFRNGSIEQITVDHRVGTHYLTRSIGNLPEVKVDIFERKLKKGDLILLATDGLTDFLPNENIVRILKKEGSKESLKNCAKKLVSAAFSAGSTDNITVGLIRVI